MRINSINRRIEMFEIFYYSGTGFTLKSAKLMKNFLKDEVKLSPIVGVMKIKIRETQAEKIGLFLPMHAFGVPKACQEFLNEFRFPDAKYNTFISKMLKNC